MHAFHWTHAHCCHRLRLAALTLAAWAAFCGPAAAADLLADQAAWQLSPAPHAARWSAGALDIAAVPSASADLPVTQRPMASAPGASWQASARLTALKPASKDAAMGLVFETGNGHQIAVLLQPGSQTLLIRERGVAAPIYGPFSLPAPAVLPTGEQTLTVTSSGGRWRVSVNGQEVMQTMTWDLAPVRVGVRGIQTDVRVSALDVSDGAPDARLMRLAGLPQQPSPRVLVWEDTFGGPPSHVDPTAQNAAASGSLLDKAVSVTKAGWSSLSSLGGLLSGGSGKGKELTRSERWQLKDSPECRLGEGESDLRCQPPANTFSYLYPVQPWLPMHAAKAVEMVVNMPDWPANATAETAGELGVVMKDERSLPKGSRSAHHLVAALAPDGLSLWEYRGDTGKDVWMLLGRSPLNGARWPQRVKLRLVHQDTSAWVFVNDQLMVRAFHVSRPFHPQWGGVRVRHPASLQLTRLTTSQF